MEKLKISYQPDVLEIDLKYQFWMVALFGCK